MKLFQRAVQSGILFGIIIEILIVITFAFCRIFNQHSSQPILEEHKSSTLIRTKKPYQSSAYELNSTNDDDYYKTYRTKSMSLQNLNSNRKPKNKNVS